jgi:hypothetical protein
MAPNDAGLLARLESLRARRPGDLPPQATPDGGVDIGFRTVDAVVGAAVIGRRTFDLGVGPWGGTPWPGVPSFVVTHRARQDLLGGIGGMFALLIPEGKPVTGTVTHLRYRVAKP